LINKSKAISWCFWKVWWKDPTFVQISSSRTEQAAVNTVYREEISQSSWVVKF